MGLSVTLETVISLTAPFIRGAHAQNLGYRPLFAISLVMAPSALFVTLRFLRSTRIGETPAVAVSSSTI